jgi:hypothetical protein
MTAKKKENQGNPVPSTGSEVDQKFLQSFYPKPAKDMKWIYAMGISVQGINVQAELIMEITEINGNDVKIKTTLGAQSFENTTTLDAFAPVPSTGTAPGSSGYIFESSEDLSVPSGNFQNAAKLSTAAREGRAYLWLAPGIGPVKFALSTGGIPATLELKEFVQ